MSEDDCEQIRDPRGEMVVFHAPALDAVEEGAWIRCEETLVVEAER